MIHFDLFDTTETANANADVSTGKLSSMSILREADLDCYFRQPLRYLPYLLAMSVTRTWKAHQLQTIRFGSWDCKSLAGSFL